MPSGTTMYSMIAGPWQIVKLAGLFSPRVCRNNTAKQFCEPGQWPMTSKDIPGIDMEVAATVEPKRTRGSENIPEALS